jgi:hypothetical protein
MNWDTRRKVLYALVVVIIVITGTVFVLRDTLFPAPTCVDGKQNGFEAGIDCGGTCALVCKQDVSPLNVVWSKAVSSKVGEYDLVALISNSNINNASLELGYKFSLYDAEAKFITTIQGTTTAPLDGKFPIIISGVKLSKKPSNVVVTLYDTSHYTVKENPTSPTIKVTDRWFESGGIARVYARLVNTKRLEINNLQVRALLYDVNDNVYAVGETMVPFIPKEGVKEVVFTWHETMQNKPTRIEIYPIFNPFEAIGY